MQHAHPDATDPLDRNWRSETRIMGFVNTIGPALFPERYDALAPTRAETGTTALEVIVLTNSKTPAADAIADRIETLLSNGEQVLDKVTGTLRPARPEDIAVLLCRHADARKTAEALSARGLPVRVQSDGWRTGPAVRTARAALHYAADPDDVHAALSFLTLGPPAVPLEDAMRMAVDGVLSTCAPPPSSTARGHRCSLAGSWRRPSGTGTRTRTLTAGPARESNSAPGMPLRGANGPSPWLPG